MDKMNPILKYFLYFCFFVMGGFLLMIIYLFLRAIFGSNTSTVAANSPKTIWDRMLSMLGFTGTTNKNTTSNTGGTEIKTKTYPVLYEVIEEIRYWYNLNEFIISKGSLIYSHESIKKVNPFQGANPSTFTQEQYNSADSDTSKWVDCLPVLLLPQMLIEIKMSSLKALTKDQAKDYFDSPRIASIVSDERKLKIGDVYGVEIKEAFVCDVKSFNLDYYSPSQESLKEGQEIYGTIDVEIPYVFPADKFQFLDHFKTINLNVQVGNKTYQIPSSKIRYIKTTGKVL